MTAIEIQLKIQRDLEHNELEKLSRLSSVYGIRRLRITGQELCLEYDATRMNEAEVLSLVHALGLPVVSVE